MEKDPFHLQNESILTLKEWNAMNENLVTGFTTKRGGFSTNFFESLNVGLHVLDDKQVVVKNRDKIARQIDIPLSHWVFADQVHKEHIQKVSKRDRSAGTTSYETTISKSDGLYTNEMNTVLALCFADCVPLYFYAPTHHMIGLAHAGWKGTVKNIAGNMLTLWTEKERIDPKDIYVSIGPSIGSCCYQVDDRVIDGVKKCLQKDANKTYTEVGRGQYRINLKLVNKLICLQFGVSEQNISVSEYCTSCCDRLFFSHRRDQGKTGRMMSFIGLKEV
ncbi:peptidoglycan editing factor PgeF [Bacillus sp. FJAT-47783]|uniref:peptidoglycan editing factor PgeF n=1 Tax=Bacillus sp. FJAT-47783 TaxID=2922712 RepID=UPI001FABF57E|nr:peptidoglycan editing factor PgeF [Bacillus sp. FJAT-47783]